MTVSPQIVYHSLNENYPARIDRDTATHQYLELHHNHPSSSEIVVSWSTEDKPIEERVKILDALESCSHHLAAQIAPTCRVPFIEKQIKDDCDLKMILIKKMLL